MLNRRHSGVVVTRGEVVALVALIGVAVALARPHLPSAVDDAFVAARYAEHLASGFGWTWSRHAPPVEGFTSPLWVAWIAVGLAVGAPVHGWMVGSGLIGGLVAIVGTWALARATADTPGPGALVAPALLACSPLVAVASTNGLETSWFIAAVVWSAWAALRAEGRGEVAAGALLGLAAWLRPEGVLLGPIWLLWRGAEGRGWRVAAAVWVALIGAWVGWRLLTFGAVVPNPAGAKYGALPWRDLYASNLLYVKRDRWTWPFVALMFVASLVGPADRRRTALGATAVAVTVPALLVPMWMPGARLLLAGFSVVAALVGGRLAANPGWAGLVAILAAASGYATWEGAVVQDVAHTVLPGNGAARAGRWLRDHAPPNASLAVRDAGCLAFWAGPGFSTHELHERALTRPHPRLEDASPDAPRNPTVLALTQAREEAGGVRYGLDQAAFEALTEPYVYLGRVHQHHHRYYDLYARADAGIPPLPEDVVVNRLGPPAPSR